MAAGDAFSDGQRREIDDAIATARQLSGLAFSVYVGASGEGGPRRHAERLHASLAEPAHSVLVLVDPAAHYLEIVTGSQTRWKLRDAATRLVALSMQTSFAAGDLVGGLTAGIHQLAEHARQPSTVLTELPKS